MMRESSDEGLPKELQSHPDLNSWVSVIYGYEHRGSIEFLREQHMQVSALITDRNLQAAKWVQKAMCPEETSHFFDIWP